MVKCNVIKLLNLVFILLTTVAYGQVDAISKIVKKIDSTEHLNGVVLVGQDGRIIFEKAYGLADFEQKTENEIDTKFLIGSLTKQFTALLMMQQVELGSINLDKKINYYLPDFKKETGNRISVRHLLTHTHGIPNAVQTERHKAMEKVDFIKKYCEADLEFEPGTEFKYSDIVGYYLLGIILEKVTNQEFGKLLEEKILQPLGLKNTGYYWPESNPKNLAKGYLQNNSGFTNAPYWDISQSFSAAGIYSTVGDLFKWDRALRTTHLVSYQSLKTIFTPYSSQIRYGFGWFINDPEINGKKRIFAGHSGGASGYKSGIMRGLDDNMVVIYLSNSDKYVEIRYPIVDALMNNRK